MSMGLQQGQLRTSVPPRHLQVFRAEDFCATDGVNEGDPLSDAADLVYEDVYALGECAAPVRLGLVTDSTAGPFLVSGDSDAGTPGAQVFLDSLLTFMEPTGKGPAGGTLEVLVFVEVDAACKIAQVYLLPLAQPVPKQGYALVTIDRDSAPARLAGTASVTVTRGTRITLAGGTDRAVEDLRPGDRVLTRDNGAQVLRRIGRDTVRAAGPFAPTTTRAGALHNAGDLTVSPSQRLCAYQRTDAVKAGRKEGLVRAAHLLNGGCVTRDGGGFVDHFQLVFDKPEIIYAECIAAESLSVDSTTAPALPDAVASRVTGAGPLPGLPAQELRKVEVRVRSSQDTAEAPRRVSAL